MDTLYKLVQWPESQHFMEHERFKECLFIQDLNGHDEVGSSAYMVPLDLYNEVHDLEWLNTLPDQTELNH